MKKLIILVTFLGLMSISYGQNPIQFRLSTNKVSTAIDGTTIGRGDDFDVIVHANGNGNTSTRQLLFDLEYDRNNFSIVSINHTGTGGNGGVLPSGSNVQLSWQNYSGFKFAGTSTSTNGSVIYQSSTYVGGGQTSQSQAIIRANLTWASQSGMPFNNFDRIIVFRFKVRPTSTATVFNPIKLNFVAGWNVNGAFDTTFQSAPLSTEIMFDQNVGKYVTANVDVPPNLLNLTNLRVSFKNTSTNTTQLFNVLSDGKVDINQSLLLPNTVYEVSVVHETSKANSIYNGAITISDFTTSQSQFQTMGLNNIPGTVLQTGQSYYAADINRNKAIDGGDLPGLLAQVAGFDTLFTVPEGYREGSGGWTVLPTWRGTEATTFGGDVEWCVAYPNGYSPNVSKILIDMREFPQGISPNSIKSLQLFDIYSGPIEYQGEDSTWATYKIPSSLIKLSNGSSTYLSLIRPMNTEEYGIKSEFEFNTSVNNSWGAITTSNWSDITYPSVMFKTGTADSNMILDLKYLVWGDVNRSHSSQVIVSNNGTSTLVSNAKNAMGPKSFSSNIEKSIDVSLSNITVTSNTIEIPVVINTNSNSVGGLQFQFDYDPTKIKFDELSTNVPNTWYVFSNSKDGKVKFGALDKDNKTSITGSRVPFSLKFSTIGNGLDILTLIKVSPTMDVSSSNGTQLGIKLNTTQIKLTGYNKF